MYDRREEILKREFDSEDFYADVKLAVQDGFDLDKLKNAMDDYMKECCLQLLSYVNENTICYDIDEFGQLQFQLKNGHWITKEQLFENFL